MSVSPRPADCPPSTATSIPGMYYRLATANLEVDAECGPEQWTLPYQKANGFCAGRPEYCNCHAHSVARDIDDLRRARLLIPGFKKKSIAKVEVSATMGTLQLSETPEMPSHHDWWPEPHDLVPKAHVVEAAE